MFSKIRNRIRTRISLRLLVSLLVISSMIVTFVICFSVSYVISHKSVTSNSLQMNSVYAAKLADMTGMMLNAMLDSLNLLSKIIGDEDREDIKGILDQYMDTNPYFNTISLIEPDLVIAVSSPSEQALTGRRVSSAAAHIAVAERRPVVSEPFLSINARMVVTISVPVFAEDGSYLGFLSGSIPLYADNILQQLLADHFYSDDSSYSFVIDRSGHIIYHPDSGLVGESILDSYILPGDRPLGSSLEVTVRATGERLLVGYAFAPAVGWGIVSATPSSTSLHELNKLFLLMLKLSLPLFLIVLFISRSVARRISIPLERLAKYASEMRIQDSDSIRVIPAWYYEAGRLKRAMELAVRIMQKRVDHLTSEASTDPLTGLYNRRVLNEKMNQLQEDGVPFTVLLLDIDHFKKTNDTFGHQTGDEVLKFFSRILLNSTRRDDICCRYGGEEFVILSRIADASQAVALAERIRLAMYNSPNPTGRKVTVSIGIAMHPVHAEDPEAVLHLADLALYQAKKNGRNLSSLYQPPDDDPVQSH